MTQFKVDNRVSVAISGTGTVVHENEDGTYDVQLDDDDDDDDDAVVAHPLNYVPAKYLVREDFPVRAGDTWRTLARAWVVYKAANGDPDPIRIRAVDGSELFYGHEEDRFRSLSPELVHRVDA